MNTYNLFPGDRLLVLKESVITHSGTHMGGGVVANMSPDKGLSLESLNDFANGQKINIRSNGGLAVPLLWERFEHLKADPNYRVLSNNCEHISNYLETGVAASKQLQGAVAGFVSGCIAVRSLEVRNPWASLLLVAVTTYLGAKMGAPKAEHGQLRPA